jgi:hypothetical protein
MPNSFDDNGWLIGDVVPYAPGDAYSLLAPDAPTTLNGDRIRHQAKKFFQIDLTLLSDKRYPGGGWPRTDRATLSIRREASERVLDLITMPLDHAPAIQRAATVAGARVGAGLDVLVARAQRLWQIPGVAGDAYPLALAAVLASLFLSPVLPPEADTVFGVKTARERLAALSWRT